MATRSARWQRHTWLTESPAPLCATQQKDFDIEGVIWYELVCCETYDSESYFFEHKMNEMGIPMLTLESSYGTADTGQMKTRVDGFIEILKGAVE